MSSEAITATGPGLPLSTPPPRPCAITTPPSHFPRTAHRRPPLSTAARFPTAHQQPTRRRPAHHHRHLPSWYSCLSDSLFLVKALALGDFVSHGFTVYIAAGAPVPKGAGWTVLDTQGSLWVQTKTAHRDSCGRRCFAPQGALTCPRLSRFALHFARPSFLVKNPAAIWTQG